ncbi:CRTAC1 family protein [Puniceicoccaceae bacterium K14]|nr:CRTAC1 family protein [Puniceicoccaceae bacterium K14]
MIQTVMELIRHAFALCLCLFFTSLKASPFAQHPWKRATVEAGLDGIQASRLKFVDLNGDLRPDIVLLPDNEAYEAPRLYINQQPDSKGLKDSFRFTEISDTNLPIHSKEDILVFADINNDGIQDAILGRNLDFYQPDYTPLVFGPTRSSWYPGKGDGVFSDPIQLADATLATTRAIAVGDVNEDGLPDLFIGNWYERYFSGYEAFENDLLLQHTNQKNQPSFVRWSIPNETLPTDFTNDLGGRPTYGAAFVRLNEGLPFILELNYGRRWNRLYKMDTRRPLREVPGTSSNSLALGEIDATSAHLVRHLKGRDIAASTGVDGDAIRHGRHQKWKQEFANEKPRSKRPDEPPFRANGNTFDVAVGDIDNDGDFDLFFSTIFHAWAGESSDLSRFLVNQLAETGSLAFIPSEHLSVNRLPPPPKAGTEWEIHHVRQNQGDIYAELADLNQDGRIDLIICSSDYPDEPPYEERLRLFFQQDDGSFSDVTKKLGIDHIGAGMPSLADVDLDGDLDLLVGQSFNRLPIEKRHQAALISGALSPDSPADAVPKRRASLFLNPAADYNNSMTLSLRGDPANQITRDAFGSIVRLTADLDNDPTTPDITQSRQLQGPGGHAGKQNQFILHFGLGKALRAKTVEIIWPNPQRSRNLLKDLKAGHHEIDLNTL